MLVSFKPASATGDPDVITLFSVSSFGLSDLHGDGRVHERGNQEGPSGFGFELTFRLKRDSEETSPPTWPANLLQSLSKYVFHSGKSQGTGERNFLVKFKQIKLKAPVFFFFLYVKSTMSYLQFRNFR